LPDPDKIYKLHARPAAAFNYTNSPVSSTVNHVISTVAGHSQPKTAFERVLGTDPVADSMW